ncbi:MAG TPA: hypothetical protein VGM59_11790 [Dongiaceae bacterium]|jgi:hypothetical protein
MTMDMEERFETDLRAAMAPEPVGNALRRRIMERATPRARKMHAGPGWLAVLDPRNWRLPVLVELGACAAAASLAVGIFMGASGDVLGTTMTTTVASADSTVDLVALAYDDTSDAGDQQ